MEEKFSSEYQTWKDKQDAEKSNSVGESLQPEDIITNSESIGLLDDVLDNGEVRRKNDAAFECIGHIDELNANIGFLFSLRFEAYC